MAYVPISGFIPSFRNIADEPGADYWLKGYIGGSTTPLSMATTKSGDTLLAKCKLNSSGEPIADALNSETVFIPFFDREYKLALYYSEADADANNNNRKWITSEVPLNFGSNSDSVANNSVFDGANTSAAINNAGFFPKQKSAVNADFDITPEEHQGIVTILTDDTAKSMTVNLTSLSAPNGEFWFMSPEDRTTDVTLVIDPSVTVLSGWTSYLLKPGKLAGFSRIDDTNELMPLGCWSS